MKSKKWVSFVVITLAFGLSSLFWQVEFRARFDDTHPTLRSGRNQRMNPGISENINIEPHESLSGRNAVEGLSDRKGSGMNDLPHTHGLTDSRVQRFTPGEFFIRTEAELPSEYEISQPRFAAHPRCQRSVQELEDSYRRSMSVAQLSGQALLPDQGRIVDLNIYFELAGIYHQISLEPLDTNLTRYQISLVQSSQQDFSEDVERFVSPRLDPLQQYLTQREAVEQLQLTLQQYAARGARWGARTALLTNRQDFSRDNPMSTSDDFTTIEYNRGQVRGFMNKTQECHATESGELECICW